MNLSPQEKRAQLTKLLQEKLSKQVAVWPLSRNQQAMWLLQRSGLYHVAFSLRILSGLDVSALQRAWQRIMDRHDLLRAVFKMKNGELFQEIAGYRQACFEVIDVSGLSETALDERVTATYRQPFDLENGPIARIHLFTRQPNEHVLLLTINHMVCDGWSLWIIMDELRQLYIAETNGLPSPLPPLRTSYQSYIGRQEAALAGTRGEALWDFWRNELAGAPQLINLPVDRSYPLIKTHRGASYLFALDSEITQQVKELAKSRSVTVFVLLLAAFQSLLYRYSMQEDFVITSRAAGRNSADFTDVVGYFANTIALRANLRGTPSFMELIERVRHVCLRVLEHQDYPFSLLIERLQPQHHPGYAPLTQVSFVFQKDHRGAVTGLNAKRFNWGNLELEYFPLAQQENWNDIELEMFEVNGVLAGAFKYNTDLFDHSTVAQIANRFEALLRSLLANPEGAAKG